MQTRFETLKQARTKAIVTFEPGERADAEAKALSRLAEKVKIPGFRPGKAPIEMLREKIKEEELLEETVRAALPDVLKAATSGEKKLAPILQPSISIESTEPLQVGVLFVEEPEVKIKNPKKLGIKKEPVPEPSTKEIDEFVNQLLDRDRSEASVERGAKIGDLVEVAMESKHKDGSPLAELSVGKYSFTLGKEELLPELEKHLHGVKKDEKKSADVSFGKNHEIPALQGKDATVHFTIKDVREVSLPALTPEYLKNRLGAEKPVEEFKKDVAALIKSQKMESVYRQREQELLKAVRDATTVDLAPELLTAEARLVLEEFVDRLSKQKLTLEDWMQSTKKDEKTVQEELMQAAKDRLTLRFGMRAATKEQDITVSDDEVIDFLKRVSPGSENQHKSGDPAFEDARMEVKVQKFVEEAIRD
ncbi:MAG: trigger factor [Candidatus Peribacteraceae bacterium]